MCAQSPSMPFVQSLEHIRKALTLAEKAFFDPSMVPLMYFPDEHKYAVYMPFFVPAAVPLLSAIYRELTALKSKVKT